MHIHHFRGVQCALAKVRVGARARARVRAGVRDRARVGVRACGRSRRAS